MEEPSSTSDELTLVWSTWPDAGSARAAARALVESRLAACIVLMPGLTSIYLWQGALEESAEVAMLIKTTAARAEALKATLAAAHPYEVPAILSWPAAAAPAYAAWAFAATADETPTAGP